MKTSSTLMLLVLVLWAWGVAAGRQAPGLMLKSRCKGASCDGAGAALGACRSSQEYQKVKPGLKFPWILAHVPVRSCHRVLKDKYGEFSPPAYHGDTPLNVWCNWTIWAGSRKHIIIYIQGFITEEGCNKNEDKILFEGISSLVENGVIYACWKKETHVFATFAQGVHVMLLKRYLPNCRETQFKGKYYIFQDQESEYSSKNYVISETPAPKLLKQGSISQNGWAKDFRHVLGFTTTRSTMSLGETRVLHGELLQGRESTLGSMAAGSRAELVTSEGARTLFLETKAPCVLESELQGLGGCKEVQGGRKPGVILPTAVQGMQGQNLSVGGDITLGFDYMQRLSSVLLETPSLSALHVVEPLLPRTGVGLEKRQPVLHPTLEPKDLEDLQFAIKPTQTNKLDLVADLQSLSLSRRESKENTDTTMYQGLDTVNLEKDERHPQLSILADSTVSDDGDGLAKGLLPSLSSPYEVVNREHSHLLPKGSQSYRSSFGDLSMIQPELGTTVLQHTKLVSISPLESFRGAVKGETVLHPIALGDILQEHPHLHDQSSHVLQSAPTDPGNLSENVQAHDTPETEKPLVSSLGVKICHHQSDRAAQQRLITPPLPTGLKHLPAATSTPGRETTSTLVVSGSEPVPADFGSTGFTSEARLPLEVGSMSKAVPSSPAALDFNAISLSQRAGISLSSPREKEIVSPSPPRHLSVASKLSTDGSPGMPKLVLGETGGQQGETSASVDLVARGPSPASITVTRPGVGLPQDNMSSGSVVAPVFLPSTSTRGVRREELKVPVQHQDMATRDELSSPSILGEFKMQKAFETLQEGAEEQKNASSSTASEHTGPPVALWGETVLRGQKLQETSGDPVSRNTQMPGGQQQNHAEQGLPWAVEYFPISSCHLIFQDGSGMFDLPLHADIKTNIWCNWTIWAGPQKHIVIYIQGFQASQGCGKNEDKIIFQGVSSSVETKVVYACHSQGTLIFATQATAVHVLFLSGSASHSNEYGHFKGQYYVFRDPKTADSSNDTQAPRDPVKDVSKKETWRTLVTKSSLPMLKASPGPSTAPTGGRIHPKLVSLDEDDLYPPSLMDNAQSGGNLSKLNLSQLQNETNLERSLKDGGTQDRNTEDDVLVKPTLAGQDAGHEAEPSVLEVAKQGIDLASALVTIVPQHPVGVSSSEVPSSNVGNSAKSLSLDQASDSLSEEVVADAHHTQTPVLAEPQLNANMKPLYPFPGLTAGDKMSLGERNKLFDLVSAPASLENDTALQSQHHPGDVLFEVTIEIKPKDWIPRCGSELQKGLLESMKNHIQENLKLSANRVSEIKLKEIKRTSGANLLVTFWLHLKPEERNVSLLLHSQLKELLGSPIGVEKLQLVSLLVEDVNECSAGVSLCGEEAECFNGVGTYLCRCKKDYEDHSPTKSGTLCIRVPQTGISFFLLHGDILVGAAIVAGLATLVAAGALCWSSKCGRHRRRNQSPEEPQVGALEEPAMELHDLGQCLSLDPFQLKLRARPPEWLWGARAYSGQAYQVFLEQSHQL